ncbi:hypothetical protein [Sabulibacter ruber]|uniref:hypothetical protein n=1 Tax=Sabulibacter ruber TaxID=2811901 RepID=UPI001A96705A|nr:hypothetical protein [Sabulibacter ruber]
MRTQLHFLLLFLSFSVFSCKDEEEPMELIEPKKLRISTISMVDEMSDTVLTTHSFVFNRAGQLDEDSSVNYRYNSNKLLVSMLLKGGNYQEDYTYDATGRMIRVNFSEREKPNQIPYGGFWLFYDSSGRINRLEGAVAGRKQFAIILSYDLAGNVTKEEGFELSPSGERSPRLYLIEISYDSKTNPFKALGSPYSRFYMPSQALQHNLHYYSSSNNPVKASYTIYDIDDPGQVQQAFNESFTYKYNELGFPVEVRTTSSLFRLEYSLY